LPVGDDVGVEISIDGRPLLELVRDAESRFDSQFAGRYAATPLDYLGLVALRDDGRSVYAGPGAFGGREGVPILVCDCGQAGCWALDADIYIQEETVLWACLSSTLSRRYADADYKSIDPLVFERQAYFEEVARLAPAIGSFLTKADGRKAD
jgi:hypothetical protein